MSEWPVSMRTESGVSIGIVKPIVSSPSVWISISGSGMCERPNRYVIYINSMKRPTFEYKSDNMPLVSAMFNNMFVFADNDQKIWTTDWEKLRNASNSRSLFTSTISNLGDRSQITALSMSQNFIASVEFLI